MAKEKSAAGKSACDEMDRIVESAVAAARSEYGLDDCIDFSVELVRAVIEVESAGNIYAQRYEAHYRYTNLQFKRPRLCGSQLEQFSQQCSYGLMQLMLATAREFGFDGWPGELFEVETNVRLGARVLASKFKRYYASDGLEGAIAAYNAGSARRDASGALRNAGYVLKVISALSGKGHGERVGVEG